MSLGKKKSRSWVKYSCVQVEFSYIRVEYSSVGQKITTVGEKQVASVQQYPTVGGGRMGASHSVGARKGVTLGKNDTL